MRYKAVLLDADETIFDFRLSERTAFGEAVAAFGITANETLYESYHEINNALWKALERGEVTKDRLRVLRFERWAEANGIRVDPAALNETYGGRLAANHHLLPGAKEFLAALHARCEIYLATNGVAQVQRQRIAQSGIAEYLDGVFISEQLGSAKPAKAYYDRVFASLPHLCTADFIAFGDSLSSDMAGACAAGIDCCWYNPAHLPLSGGVSPTYTASTYEQFLSILDEDTL